MSSSINIEILVRCDKCESPLEADYYIDCDNEAILTVQPCEDCMLDRENEAHDEGYDEGYEAGSEEAKREIENG